MSHYDKNPRQQVINSTLGWGMGVIIASFILSIVTAAFQIGSDATTSGSVQGLFGIVEVTRKVVSGAGTTVEFQLQPVGALVLILIVAAATATATVIRLGKLKPAE